MKQIWITLLLLIFISAYASCYAENDANKASSENETYIISRISGSPEWNKIPEIPIDKVLWTEDTGIRAKGQLCYDEEYLYVHLSAAEKDIRAEYTEPLSPVYEDSCLEFFFQFSGSDNYFNFEINPNGCLCIQFGPSKTDRINIIRDDAAEYFDIHTNRVTNGWETRYRIPLSFLKLFYPDARFGGEWRANFYKCGNKTINRHFLSWTKIELETPNFHCPQYFGTIIFN